MASLINPAFPIHGNPTTQSVRDNFQAAANEINALQADTGHLQGEITRIEDEGVKKSPAGDVHVTQDLSVQRHLILHGVQTHATNAAAHAAGLPVGTVYRDLLGELHIVH